MTPSSTLPGPLSRRLGIDHPIFAEPTALDAFRHRIRTFLQDHLPPDVRDTVHRGQMVPRERMLA